MLPCNYLLSCDFILRTRRSGFQVDSPTKSTFASETPHCAPPYTFCAGEEPCQGGDVEVGPWTSIASPQRPAYSFPRSHLFNHLSLPGTR